MTEIEAIDAHTAGEPFRVITAGLPEVPGADMLAKRRWARERLDDLRRVLMWEPRGHADMYGCILTEPVSDGADFGVLFLHNEGFSTMCGHGIIGVATVLVLEPPALAVTGPCRSANVSMVIVAACADAAIPKARAPARA